MAGEESVLSLSRLGGARPGGGGWGGRDGEKRKVVSLRLPLKDASAAIRCPALIRDGI